MKFTLSWLKKFLDTNASVIEIGEHLTDLGLEVEEIIDRSAELKDFEVAYILATKPHPSADKLQICDVETKDGMLQIVCGASNARAGIKVVLAKIGATIPNGKFKIKESLIRGEKSFGMLCSEEELFLQPTSDGIIELPENAVTGEPFIKYYGLDDPVFDINVTPNRGDALGVYGIARDLAAKGVGKLKELQTKEIKDRFQSSFKVTLEDQDTCKLFAVREIRNVQNRPSPDWLKQLLQNVGLKPISSIVDITNYICYSFARPLHAYDKDKLSNNLHIAPLKKPAKFLALNDKEYDLQPDDLVIQSGEQQSIHCLAGIIGGQISSCDQETKNIVLEAACFSPKYVTRTGRRLQLDTDARYRAERNLDQAFTINGLDIATEMILSLCGGEASQIIYQGDTAPSQKILQFPIDYLEKIAGLHLVQAEISDILTKLGFGVEDKGNILTLTVPSWRHDIEIKEDIVEEIVRIYGYEKLAPLKLPDMEVTRIIPREQKRISGIRRVLANCGYDEVVTNSFMEGEVAKLFAPLKEELFLLNPISIDNNYMRPSIIPNLLQLMQKNLARSVRDIAFMEVGPIFPSWITEGELTFVSAVRCGHFSPKTWHSDVRFVDVFDVKSDLENILNYAGLSLDQFQYSAIDLPYYHPTKSTTIKLGKNIIAYFGQIHPLILKHFDIHCEVFALEANINNIPLAKAKYGRRDDFVVSDFQISFRDYAFIVDINKPVGEIIAYIKNSNKKLIQSVDLFDVYSGDQVPAGKKSLAIKVQLQADDRTLTEEDLTSISQGIIDIITQKFQGQLRGIS